MSDINSVIVADYIPEGYWICDVNDMTQNCCAHCGSESTRITEYCPHCGCRMVEEEFENHVVYKIAFTDSTPKKEVIDGYKYEIL